MDVLPRTTYHDDSTYINNTYKENSATAFDSYDKRLQSFTDWKNDQVTPEILAKAGFFYTNFSDVVRCPFCGIEGYRWVSGDIPMDDHRTWSPTCPFVRNQTDGTQVRSVDTCGKHELTLNSNTILNQDAFKRLGLQKVQPAAYPQYTSPEKRLETFELWPKSLKQKPADLADAGFFYVNTGDQTLCFSCGGGLKDWEEDDDPWEQHAFWFGNCSYLLLKKGAAYVDKVKGSKKGSKPEEKETAPPAASTSSSEPSAATASCSSTETKDNSNEQCKKPTVTSESDPTSTSPSEKTLCKICYKNELAVVFLPCGHIVACVDCASGMKKCPVCRETLQATIRAFLS